MKWRYGLHCHRTQHKDFNLSWCSGLRTCPGKKTFRIWFLIQVNIFILNIDCINEEDIININSTIPVYIKQQYTFMVYKVKIYDYCTCMTYLPPGARKYAILFVSSSSNAFSKGLPKMEWRAINISSVTENITFKVNRIWGDFQLLIYGWFSDYLWIKYCIRLRTCFNSTMTVGRCRDCQTYKIFWQS